MNEPFVVTVQHSLGREEARRRLQSGFVQARAHLPGLEESWEGERMAFRFAIMGQSVSGHIDVLDDCARIELILPRALGWLARTIGGRVSEQARLMLEKR
jgi:hypothetical protein